MSQILIVEDEAVIRHSLRRLLERHAYRISEAGSVKEAVDTFQLSNFDLVITDLRLPGAPGTDLIALAEGVPVLVMTSFASLKSAVDSMRLGAVDYIAKPFDHEEMVLAVGRILKEKALERENAALRATLNRDYPVNGMIGDCVPMQELFKKIQKVAPTDSTVLIRGESGTGKELVARAMHAQSLRARGPLISVNCAAIPETLIEAELFGHEEGAFTGASRARLGRFRLAHGGTLVLEDIDALPLDLQGKLLRALQEGEVEPLGAERPVKVDVRVVATSARDLRESVASGRLRSDLFWRLAVLELAVPPLRARTEDIVPLAQRMLARLGSSRVLSESAQELLRAHPWPGNVRELENALERVLALAGDAAVAISPEEFAFLTAAVADEPDQLAARALAHGVSLEALETALLRGALREQRGNIAAAARRVGLSRRAFEYRLSKLAAGGEPSP